MKLKESLLIVLIFIVAIVIGVFVGLKISDNRNDVPVNEVQGSFDNSHGSNGNEENNFALSASQKSDYNTKIFDKLLGPMESVVNSPFKKIEFQQNYLDDIQNKVAFMWSLCVEDKSLVKKYDVNVQGVGVTGAIAIEKDDFINKFFHVFNESITTAEIVGKKYSFSMNETIQLADDYLYGGYVTGYEGYDFALKAVSYIEDIETNLYELTMELLTKFTTEESNGKIYNRIDDDFFEKLNDKYISPTVLDYPNDIVYANVKLGLTRLSDRYVITYIKFEQ